MENGNIFLSLSFYNDQLTALESLEEAIKESRQNCGHDSDEVMYAKEAYQNAFDNFLIENVNKQVFVTENRTFEIRKYFKSHLCRWCEIMDMDYEILDTGYNSDFIIIRIVE